MNHKGFTLIELVMVIVLISIIAVFAVPRLGDVTSTKASAFKQKLRADIRYAQNLAMTQGRRTRVNFIPTSYGITRDISPTNTCNPLGDVPDPAGGTNFLVTLDTGIYAGIRIGPSSCLEFDSLGRPYDCTLAPAPGLCSTTPAGRIITIFANAVAVDTVTITAQTGAVN